MEKARKCALLGYDARPGDRPVWVRKGLVTVQCPKSLITSESEGWLAYYGMRRMVGDSISLEEMDARQAEALAVLEGESRKEVEK
ncbi:MAG: hypothetical protein HY820_10990 [Acidobacteria bacterium]|nr:hypothetical protein [Acidobacteriota bacterium]